MKKIICLLFVFTILLSLCASAEGIKVFVNDKELNTPVESQIVNNRTVCPMRAIFESLGAKVEWFEADQLIFAIKDDTLLTLKIGTYEMIMQKAGENKSRIIDLDVAPFIIDGSTLIPARAISEALNADVEWIEETRQVKITAK